MATILSEKDGHIGFSNEIEEYILDGNMELKAVRLRDGSCVDHEHLHKAFSPKHPLLKTPSELKKTLDRFFIHEFVERRAQAI
ncbi:MAG: hypothetical protein V1875_05660 [Candidatus Altiarchaeota archaeon]